MKLKVYTSIRIEPNQNIRMSRTEVFSDDKKLNILSNAEKFWADRYGDKLIQNIKEIEISGEKITPDFEVPDSW